MTPFYCSRCGTVREATSVPWCRHGDIDIPAERMVVLPDWHPFARKDALGFVVLNARGRRALEGVPA